MKRILMPCAASLAALTFLAGATRAQTDTDGKSGARIGPAAVGGNLPAAPLFKVLVRNQLTSEDRQDRVRRGCYAKTYGVKLPAGRLCAFELESAQLDTYLRLEDVAGNVLAEGDSDGFPSARLSFTPRKAGSYRLVVTTFGPSETGAFVVRYRLSGRQADDGQAPSR